MSDALHNAVNSSSRRQPWNKGKLIGPKPPLRPGHVWSIRTNLQLHGRIRDLDLRVDADARWQSHPGGSGEFTGHRPPDYHYAPRLVGARWEGQLPERQAQLVLKTPPKC